MGRRNEKERARFPTAADDPTVLFLEKTNADPEHVVLFQLVELSPKPPDFLCYPYKEETQFFAASSKLPHRGVGHR